MTQKQKPNYASLKREAKDLYFKGKSLKEIAGILKIHAVTLSTWSRIGGWKAEREARLDNERSRIDNIQQVIDCLVKQRLSLVSEALEAEQLGDAKAILEITRKKKGISDEISKLRKEKEDIRTDGKKQLSLSKYLEVMDSVFRHMQSVDPKLYHSTLDFQELHVSKITQDMY